MTMTLEFNLGKHTIHAQGVQGGSPVIQGLKNDDSRMKIYPEQKIYFVCDNSGSVSGDPADQINQATKNMMSIMSAPENKDGFRVSVIMFGSNADLVCEDKAPQDVNLAVDGNGGGTELTPALDIVAKLEGKALIRPNRVKVNSMMIILSDGGFGDTAQSIQMIDGLKQQGMQVMTIGVGDACDEAVLRNAATSSDFYAKTDGSGLMSLLAKVGKTMSQGLIK